MLPTTDDAYDVGPGPYKRIITSCSCVDGTAVDSRTVPRTGICGFVSNDHKLNININLLKVSVVCGNFILGLEEIICAEI